MAHIGIFKRKNDGYKGTVRTLTLDREIDIIPAVASDAENAPDYRVLTGEVAVAGLIGPERDGARDDGSFWQWSEVAAVETVGFVPVHEKDLVVADDVAALPVW